MFLKWSQNVFCSRYIQCVWGAGSAPVTLQFNVTRGCGRVAKTKRDASRARECVSHWSAEGNGGRCQVIWPSSPCSGGTQRHQTDEHSGDTGHEHSGGSTNRDITVKSNETHVLNLHVNDLNEDIRVHSLTSKVDIPPPRRSCCCFSSNTPLVVRLLVWSDTNSYLLERLRPTTTVWWVSRDRHNLITNREKRAPVGCVGVIANDNHFWQQFLVRVSYCCLKPQCIIVLKTNIYVNSDFGVCWRVFPPSCHS